MTPPPMGGSLSSGLCLSCRRELHGHPGWPSSRAVTQLSCFVWGSHCSRATAGSRAGLRAPAARDPVSAACPAAAGGSCTVSGSRQGLSAPGRRRAERPPWGPPARLRWSAHGLHSLPPAGPRGEGAGCPAWAPGPPSPDRPVRACRPRKARHSPSQRCVCVFFLFVPDVCFLR